MGSWRGLEGYVSYEGLSAQSRSEHWKSRPYSTRKIAWNPDETRHLQESKWKSLSMN